MKIIGIIGRICSGKSTITEILKKNYTITKLSFGEYLFHHSKKNGLNTDRISLQNLGEKFINDNANDFLNKVLERNSPLEEIVVIEGIRHKAILQQLNSLNSTILFIYLDVPLLIRYGRYASRKKIIDKELTFEEFKEMDKHPVEQEISSLKKFCAFKIKKFDEKKFLKEIEQFLSSSS